MSDDLIKRLRDAGDHARFEPHMYHEAADRIAALEAEVAIHKAHILRLLAAAPRPSRLTRLIQWQRRRGFCWMT